MAGVDFEYYRFDFDLTFAALLMNADGTIYHTYGGRDWTDPQSHLSVRAFVEVLQKALREHQAYQADPKPPKKRRRRTVEQVPPMARRIASGKAPDCFHCHMVHDALRDDLRARKKWRRDDAWLWPDPVQVGVRLGKDDQTRVTEVVPRSAAAKGGLEAGDRLLTLGGSAVLTFGDVQRVLHEATGRSATLTATWAPGGDVAEQRAGRLRLPSGWKEPDPLVFSWRPSKWGMSPKPGFGGPQLEARDLERLGLPTEAFAFRIQYLVTWGANAHTGRNARRAGLRQGDVVIEVGGKRDFESVDHFHAWFRLTQRPGATVRVEVIRNKERKSVPLPVVE